MAVCSVAFGRSALALVILSLVASCETPARAGESAGSPGIPGSLTLPLNSPKLAALRIDTATLRRERSIALLPAHIASDETRTSRVISPVVGRVTKILVRAGDRVVAGQSLAEIASPDAAQATAELAKAKASESIADVALARAEDLYAHHVVALRDVELARSDAQQTRAERGRAQTRAAQLGVRTDSAGANYVLRAPLAGVVIDLTATPGEEVRPDATSPLFTISSLQQVWMVVHLYQRDIAHAIVGSAVVFTTDAMPGREFRGRLSYVAAALDPLTRTAVARATLENRDGALKPELSGEARLLAVVKEADALPVIRSRALLTHGQDIIVYVATQPGTFERRVVRVAEDDGTWATLSAGLRAGERVVTDGALLLDAEVNRVR